VDRAMRGHRTNTRLVEPKKQKGPQKLVFRANLNLEQHGGPHRSVLE